ncbi:MAG: tryptophan-rich sensory protein [Ignavibacteria bacterium]|nr:tryptophan-rich sensory protein [Ignavibacteria bacterium]
MSNLLKLIISIGVCLFAGAIGSYFTADAIPGWYETLNKPEFNPPNWVFGPVWTFLYILMGISLFLVWKEGPGNTKVKPAMLMFWVQLGLNILWSVVFFGMRNISGGLLVIILLWVSILFTILRFRKISAVAGTLLVPYILWVTFASALNFFFYRLN